MKPSMIFHQYVWIINTLRRKGRLTFEQLNRRWMAEGVADGNPLPRSTFNRHRDAILDIFRLIDEWQYERTGEVTADMVREMMDKAVLYQPEDLHYKPTMPGQGFDDRQNTFILMWNPAISSYKLEVHNESIGNLLTECFNWSISDYAKAKCGDRFYLVRCGEGNTGIVMSGVFDSHPYKAGDWSGRGRTVYYMDMIPNLILNPDKAPMITTEQLLKAIPTFDWTGGRSGRLLPKEDAKILESLWQQFIETNEEKIDGITMNAIKLYN